MPPSSSSSSSSCSSCGSAAQSSCSRCKSAFYCCRACQKKHWPSHKPLCSQVSESWSASDLQTYGAWAPRVVALLPVRPLYVFFVWIRPDFLFQSHRGAEPEPFRAQVSVSTPAVADDAASELLKLADEVRHAIGELGGERDSATRSQYHEIAFEILRLAASPHLPQFGEEDAINPAAGYLGAGGACPAPRPKAELDSELNSAIAALSVSAASARSGQPSGRPVANESNGDLSGGNAEAQFRMGLYYSEGIVDVCGGSPRVKPALFWMFQAATQGYAPALAWLRANEWMA